MSKYQFSFATCEGASLCVPLCPLVSFICLYALVSVCFCYVCGVSPRCACFCLTVCVCLCQRNMLLERKTGKGKVLLGMETAIISPSGKNHKHSPIHALFFIFSLSHILSPPLSLSLSLYHLQRQRIPPPK